MKTILKNPVNPLIILLIMVLGCTEIPDYLFEEPEVNASNDISSSSGGGNAELSSGSSAPWKWVTLDDSGNSGSSTVNMVDNSGAIVVFGNVTSTYQYGYAGIRAEPNEEMLARLKAATSVSFKVRGDGKKYRVIFPTSNITDFSYYRAIIDAGAAESTVTINLASGSGGLSHPGWGESEKGTLFDKTKVTHIEWQTNDGAIGSFNLMISDLRLN